MGFIGPDPRRDALVHKMVEIHKLVIERALKEMLEEGKLSEYVMKALENLDEQNERD